MADLSRETKTEEGPSEGFEATSAADIRQQLRVLQDRVGTAGNHRHVLDMLLQGEATEHTLREICRSLEMSAPGIRCGVVLAAGAAGKPAPEPSRSVVHQVHKGLGRASDFFDCASDCTFTDLPTLARTSRGLEGETEFRGACAVAIPQPEGAPGGAFVILHEHRPAEHCPRIRQGLRDAGRLAGLSLWHSQLRNGAIQRAGTDRLTGLANRWFLEQRLDAAVRQAAASSRRVGLLWLNLDRFRGVNDALGHTLGDDVLIQAGARIAGLLPAGALAARERGDEFVVLLPGLASAFEAESLASALCDEFRRSFEVGGYELYVTASVGVSVYPDDAQDASDLLRHADLATANAKSRGRNMVRHYESRLGAALRSRLELEHSLVHALPRSEFELYYQPQVTLDGKLRGVEALLRWRHPKLGLLIPGDFIPIAEERGLILPMGAWALREGCRQAAAWLAEGAYVQKVAVNVSSLQFYQTNFVQEVERALGQANLPPQYLELELTESVLLCNFDEAARSMQRLQAAGVSIALDDFGTGYSSLSYLRKLPVNAVKIDRSFLDQLDDVSTIPVLRAVTDLAHSLRHAVIAEGLETLRQVEVVRDLGFDYGQGYYFGRPAPAASVTECFTREHTA